MATKPNPKAIFKTTLLQGGKTATGIKIPPEIIETLGAGKKPPIKVTINGFTYRSTVAVMGGDYMVGVSAENRLGAKVNGGDKIEVAIELDTEARELELPIEFKKELDKNAKAKKAFESLSYSKKRVHVQPIASAKTDETRQRNINKAITILSKTSK